jgi:hypothetical protein
MKTFTEWLELREGFSTGGKLGLYAPIDDALGQYPPLYATARIPDVITYIDIAYNGGVPKSKNGIVKYDKDIRISHAAHKAKHSVWNFPSSLGFPKTSL